MKDNEIVEAYFKAYGVNPNFPHSLKLPNILDHYPAFKEHVLEVMEGEGYGFRVNFAEIVWRENQGFMEDRNKETLSELFLDNNILHAAVIAATRYFEEKKDE